MKKPLVLLMLCVFCFLGQAQYTVLYNFSTFYGTQPDGNLVLSGNRFFGMASLNGWTGYGCIFSIDTSGNNYRELFSFNNTRGNEPTGSPVISGNKIYGVTFYGGANGYGCAFSVDTNGSGYKDLHDFTSANSYPSGTLVLSGKKLYGVTVGYGSQYGSVFSIDTDGTHFNIMHFFSSNDGATIYPYLVLSGKTLFGMAYQGGANNDGDIFSIDTNGARFKDLFDFNITNGANPGVTSLLVSGGQLFGVTAHGGVNYDGVIFSIDTNGRAYKKLYDFSNATGQYPSSSLILSGSTLWGMAYLGGAFGSGVIFSIDSTGTGYQVRYDFNSVNGTNPEGGVTLSGRNVYGMTNEGGTHNPGGVIFKMDTSNIPNSTKELLANQSAINVFPNPSNGKFTIQNTGARIQNSEVEIYNVLGEQVYSSILPQTPKGASTLIDISNQPAGVYMYRIVDKTGAIIDSGKLIIQ